MSARWPSPGASPLLRAARPGAGGAAAVVRHACGCGCWPSRCSSPSTCCSPPRPGVARDHPPPTAPVRLGHPTYVDAAWSPTRPAPGHAASLRDAWQPTAGATRQPLPAAARPRATGCCCGRRCSPYAAATCAPHGVTVRARGPARPGLAAAHRRRARRGALAAAVRVAQAPAVTPGPAARPRRARRRCGCAGRAPSSTRCASTSAATTSARSTGGRPPATATSWSAPGSPSATGGWCSSSTPRAPRPAGWTTYPVSTPRWTPPCCLPPSPPAPATASTSWPATAGSGPGCAPTGARDAASTLQDTMADLEPVIAEADWAVLAGAVTVARAAARARGAADPAGVLGRRGGAAARAADADQAPPRRPRLGQGPRPRPPRRDPRRHRRGLRRRGRRAASSSAARGTADLLRALGVDVVDASADQLPPALADHYLALKARGLL